MRTLRKFYLSILVLSALLVTGAKVSAQCTSGSSPTWYWTLSSSPSGLQTCINGASPGDTINISAGSVTWSSGVNFSGIHLAGAGSGRVIAYDDGTEMLTVGTGTLTVHLAGFSPGFSGSSITTGETLQVFENDFVGNYMQGTVTSYNSSTNNLVMNITSTGGSGTTHRWLVATLPSTVITDNSSGALFNMTESTTQNTSLSGIQISATTSAGAVVYWNYTSGGQPMLVHDNYFINNGAPGEMVDSDTNRGVIWNNSFVGNSQNINQLVTTSVVRIKIGTPPTGAEPWLHPAFWGTNDTTGANNLYAETNDVHAFQSATDNDDNGRMVWRYNVMDNTGIGTHGADTSPYGMRTFEIYNNTGVFNGYSDGTTFNVVGWVFIARGGSYAIHDNNWPAISSTDLSKSDVTFTVMNLQRSQGPNPCWGAGFTTAGQYYHAPRQVGYGYVTGTGTANYPPLGVNNSSTDSITYVGDLEPAYIWNNSRSPLGVGIEDYGLGNSNSCSSSPTPDSSANYIVAGRDYYNGTAKPGYSPYTYPHPLTQASGGSGTTVNPPTGLTATVQ